MTGPEEGSKAFIRRAKDAADREKWRVTKDSDVAIDISVEGEGEGEGEGEDGSVTNRDTATKAGAGEEEEEKDSFHIEGDKSRGVDQYMAKFSAAARMADLSCFADQFRGTTAAQKNELVPYARSSQVLSWLSHAGKFRGVERTYRRGYYSMLVIVVSCFMWSGVLDSYGILLSHSLCH